MIIRPYDTATGTATKAWLKRLSWALPLFFLLKGLMWLALPLLLAVYGLH